jgi:hypothetical protein
LSAESAVADPVSPVRLSKRIKRIENFSGIFIINYFNILAAFS